jgi:acetyl-CoA carboxylase biotin carboxyl carrier protein
VDLKDIKAIVDLMKKNSLSEFELEKDDFKIKLRRGLSAGACADESPYYLAPPVSHVLPAAVPQVGAHPATPASFTTPGDAQPKSSSDLDITSPMIGTFYASPSPDSPAYVEVGTRVNAETVVCIVEAMKVMNEIKAEKSGVITEILVDNAKPVEFGQPLFKIKPN